MMPADRILDALEARGLTARGNADRGWLAQCPAHDDRNASLSISIGTDGRVLLHCHAGCVNEGIVTALALEWSDLFPEGNHTAPRPTSRNGRRPTSLPTAAVLDGNR